ncbi:MAG TPA: hypothetical protein VG798_00830 [Rhizomicrobium sp.]|nr:hypothetical protein [Rhizomicrobium sp.]HWC63779.1 hypothetical protein [Rhizomicrobium sp.]
MRRGFIAAIAAVTFVVTPLLAAETVKGPLAPGKPAGVRKAQVSDGEWTLLAIGGAGLIAGLAIAGEGSDGVPITPITGGGSTTTTSTST